MECQNKKPLFKKKLGTIPNMESRGAKRLLNTPQILTFFYENRIEINRNGKFIQDFVSQGRLVFWKKSVSVRSQYRRP